MAGVVAVSESKPRAVISAHDWLPKHAGHPQGGAEGTRGRLRSDAARQMVGERGTVIKSRAGCWLMVRRAPVMGTVWRLTKSLAKLSLVAPPGGAFAEGGTDIQYVASMPSSLFFLAEARMAVLLMAKSPARGSRLPSALAEYTWRGDSSRAGGQSRQLASSQPRLACHYCQADP